MKQTLWAGCGLGLSLLCSSGLALADEAPKNFGVDVKLTGESQEDRDLGTAPGGTVNGVGIDVRPWAFGLWGNWSAYIMGQGVAATDTIDTDQVNNGVDNADAREADDSYLALREFWIDYSGITAYPGEHLRLGRQRLREETGQWMDSNIEALNWSFETTLLRAHLGVAQRFSDYRTDYSDLAPEDEDRTHGFGDISTQWLPNNWIGLRVHHVEDSGSLPNPGEQVEVLDKSYTGNLTWVGLETNGDGYNYRSTMPVNYWINGTWLTGNRDNLSSRTDVNGNRIAVGSNKGDVNTWAADLGLRWNINDSWRLGAAAARGEGGGVDKEDQFQQTGLHSNRSSYTGTRSRVHRFGEAFRGELSNLQSATLFGAWQLRDDYDASLVYHRFWRVDELQETGDNGIINTVLVDGEKDLGQEVDLVLTKYFKQGLLPSSMVDWVDEPSALVRLRVGVFLPGDAYADDTDSSMHRAFLDFVWKI
ncbi:alginate export family protein [Pseudomonas sp. R5(2019)]|uniref:alginate export family protein n=1 Tax=Pseudomonas sp. R5(2019) TaxID=2697566 RepID=UPI0014130FFA|nr:alginate export family protein [Pseudomonas sp. R5(2019)]NBA94859.1 alginate export family protein [Pseudomonas sp. R5(2019)]